MTQRIASLGFFEVLKLLTKGVAEIFNEFGHASQSPLSAGEI